MNGPRKRANLSTLRRFVKHCYPIGAAHGASPALIAQALEIEPNLLHMLPFKRVGLPEKPNKVQVGVCGEFGPIWTLFVP